MVSQTGVLSLSPGATSLPRNPMMMPAMMTPMTLILSTFQSVTTTDRVVLPSPHVPHPSRPHASGRVPTG
jgi:hypothetical protein